MIAFLPNKEMVPLIEALAGRLEVIAPVLSGGQPVFATWNGQELALDAENPLSSPLEFLLPSREALFRYVQLSGRYTFEEPLVSARLIFGIRPCDLFAVEVLDRIMTEEPCDQAYLGRRRSTVLVALNCTRPGSECTCAQMGSGPGCVAGFDLAMTPLGDGYLVESGSPAGVLILREHPEFFREARDEEIEMKGALLNESREQMIMTRPDLSLQSMQEAIRAADWERLGDRCLRCGGCSFICPTCHCFNVLDQGVPDGERVRCADSCILSGFSRMTSGANPRATQGERLANWYRDKFIYMPEKTGLPGCVGCGRCHRVCLARFDRRKLEALL